MGLSRGPLLLLIGGIVAIGWALAHAAGGDGRCEDRCKAEGFVKHRYVAPMYGNHESCNCIDDKGVHTRME